MEILLILGTALLLAACGIGLFVQGYNMGRHSYFQAMTWAAPTTEPKVDAAPKKETQKPIPAPPNPGGPFDPVRPFEEVGFGPAAEVASEADQLH